MLAFSDFAVVCSRMCVELLVLSLSDAADQPTVSYRFKMRLRDFTSVLNRCDFKKKRDQAAPTLYARPG